MVSAQKCTMVFVKVFCWGTGLTWNQDTSINSYIYKFYFYLYQKHSFYKQTVNKGDILNMFLTFYRWKVLLIREDHSKGQVDILTPFCLRHYCFLTVKCEKNVNNVNIFGVNGSVCGGNIKRKPQLWRCDAFFFRILNVHGWLKNM